MQVNLIFISFLLSGRVVFGLSSFSLVLADPCGRGGVREHPGEWTRSGAVRLSWIRRNRHLAALASALTRSAGSYEVDARSLRPTVVTSPEGSISRDGWAPGGPGK